MRMRGALLCTFREAGGCVGPVIAILRSSNRFTVTVTVNRYVVVIDSLLSRHVNKRYFDTLACWFLHRPKY